ncbi:MAG: hypothetical protein V1859_02890 [archaeon]
MIISTLLVLLSSQKYYTQEYNTQEDNIATVSIFFNASVFNILAITSLLVGLCSLFGIISFVIQKIKHIKEHSQLNEWKNFIFLILILLYIILLTSERISYNLQNYDILDPMWWPIDSGKELSYFFIQFFLIKFLALILFSISTNKIFNFFIKIKNFYSNRQG